MRAEHANRIVLHAVEEQAKFVFGKPKPLGVVLQLGIERNDAPIGLVELSVGTLERAGFVFVESSARGTVSRPIDEVRIPGSRELVGTGGAEEGPQRYDGTKRRRHDDEAVDQQSERRQRLLEGDQTADALDAGDMELGLERRAVREHELGAGFRRRECQLAANLEESGREPANIRRIEPEFFGRQPCPPAKRDDILLDAQDDCRQCETATLGEGICPVHDEDRQPGALPGQTAGTGAFHAGKS